MESKVPLFSEHDRSVIESSVYNPNSKPNFNPLSSLLFWDDERPRGLSPAAVNVLNALWMARALLYYDYELPGDLWDPEHFKSIWDRAVESGIKWTGFDRLKLSDEDRQYYLTELHLDRPERI